MLSKKRVAPNPSVVNRDEWATGADEFAKLGALVKSSRGKLRALANAQTFNEMASAVTDLGDIDAAHIVLLVAKVDIDFEVAKRVARRPVTHLVCAAGAPGRWNSTYR